MRLSILDVVGIDVDRLDVFTDLVKLLVKVLVVVYIRIVIITYLFFHLILEFVKL